MKVIDPGHTYRVDGYDGPGGQVVTFMKREGDGYPGNTSHYPGTNCQELIRVLIDRVKYLNKQDYSKNNDATLVKLRQCLWLFEDRAATRHNIDQFDFQPHNIELAPTCSVCGHIICKGHNESGSGKEQGKLF